LALAEISFGPATFYLKTFPFQPIKGGNGKECPLIASQTNHMSSISSVSSTTNPYPSASQSGFGQLVQDFKSLGSALQSGDLSTAQSALAAVQQALQGNSQASSSQPFGKNSQANTDYQTLASALQSGDLAGAQKAFASLQTDLKAAHKGHHHHSPGTTTSSAPTSPAATTSSKVDSDGDNDGSNLNVMA
jgi:DNA-binding FadR family transcriptional regulator